MILGSHILALVAVAGLVGLAAVAYQVRSLVGRRAVLAVPAGNGRGEPYVLYFTGPNCTICKTHQEPALSRLEGVSVQKVDAVEQRDLADLFHVYTVPTTVVIGPDGKPGAVNYGYAPAEKLKKQLAAIA